MSASGYAAAGTAGLQMWAGFQQAEMIRGQGRLQQQINDMNAEFAEVDAFHAEQFGFTESARYQSVIDSTVADQKLIFASQDVDVNYGTAAELQAETKLTGLLNTLDIQKQAREKASGFKREARNIRLGSSFQRSQTQINASAAQTSGILSAAGTAASGYARK